MARIDGPAEERFGVSPSRSRKKKSGGRVSASGTAGARPDFPDVQNAGAGISEINTDEELQSVIDSIHQLGDNLLKYPNPDTLARYKQAVRDFIAHVTHNAYAAVEYLSRKDILKQKKYILIQTVNEKLEKLSKNILSSQKSQIELLSSIEEIQGLLVDLVHVT